MMWGCFAGDTIRTLIPLYGDPISKRGGVTGRVYLAALQRELVRVIEQFEGEEIIYFMQDNAGIHRWNPVKEWLENLRTTHGVQVEVIKWPPYSPDLNPIEHVWAILKALFHKMYPDMWKEKGPKHIIRRRIEAGILRCWELIPSSYFDRLVESMPDRIEAVIASEGWYTKY